MKQSKKNFITMIELLIVMALLSIVAATFSIGISHFKKQELYSIETNEILHLLQNVEELMVIAKDNLQIAFRSSDGFTEVTIVSDLLKKSKVASKIVNERLEIRSIELSFVPKEELPIPLPFTLSFSSLNDSITAGTLVLQNKNNLSEKKYIVFKGYPHPFKIENHPPLTWEETEANQLYPQEIRSLFEKSTKAPLSTP